MMDEPAAAGTFDKPLSAVTTGTEWMKGGREGGREGGRSSYMRRADRPQMMADGVKGGIVKKKKDRRSIRGIGNMVSAPRRGGGTWQAGRWAAAVCVTDWEIRADMQRSPTTQTPGSEAYDCSRGRGDTWTHRVHTHTHVHAHTHSAGVTLHRLSLITATVPAFRAGAPNYTAQPQQGRCAQQSFVRLIICLGLVIVARTGTQVIVW